MKEEVCAVWFAMALSTPKRISNSSFFLRWICFPFRFPSTPSLIYFELSEAFYDMLPTGHIEEVADSVETLYRITEKGRETTRIFEKQLPYPVREAAQRSALRVVRQIRRDAAIRTRVSERSEHDLTVRMEMDQVFAIEMDVVNRSQAALLERTFKSNAEAIYQTLLSAMTANYETRKEEDAT